MATLNITRTRFVFLVIDAFFLSLVCRPDDFHFRTLYDKVHKVASRICIYGTKVSVGLQFLVALTSQLVDLAL